MSTLSKTGATLSLWEFSCWQGLDPGLVNGITRSESLQMFWVGYDSCSSARVDSDMSVLKLSWEAASCNGHFCLKEMDAVSLVAFSVVRLTELGCTKLSLCPFCVHSSYCSSKAVLTSSDCTLLSSVCLAADVSLSPAFFPEILE